MGNILSSKSCIKNHNFHISLFGKKREKKTNTYPLVATPLYYQYPIQVSSLITNDISFQQNENVVSYDTMAPYFINQLTPLSNNYLTEENTNIIQPTFPTTNQVVC